MVILKLIFTAITSLFNHMGSVCGYLGGLIGYAGATYENTRYILQELACRDPFDIDLQKGYVCEYSCCFVCDIMKCTYASFDNYR